MLTKVATFNLSDLKLLNTPERDPVFVDRFLEANSDELQSALLICTASNKRAESSKDGDNKKFDLEAEIKSHPKSLFVKCFAIKADEMNDNGDYFAYDQLKESTASFVGVPIFTNHQNTDVEASRGKVIYSWWDEDRKGIMIIARIDSEAYPQLARGIKEQIITGTSMGCSVKYSLCSICHNLAETPDQYCSHIRERKTRNISAKNVKCEYHKLGTEDQCPLCGCKKGETKTHDVEKKAFEYNYGIKFIENSFVVNPACHDCGVTEVIDPQTFLAKVSSIAKRLPRLLKTASEHSVMCTDSGCIRLAGQKEIQDLNDAVNKMISVSQSMLQQKDQIDLEFVSDLVKVVADLQTVTDELTQQGYARLQSPSQGQSPSDQIAAVQPPQSSQTSPVNTPPIAPDLHPVNPTAGGGSKVQSGSAGASGTVTGPALNLAENKIHIEKLSKNLLQLNKTLKINLN